MDMMNRNDMDFIFNEKYLKNKNEVNGFTLV